MKIFKEKIKQSTQMLTIVILGLGVILTVVGLFLGLKNFDPKYFNAIAGAIIVLLTLFGLFGKLFQDISSSKTQQEIKKNTERALQPFAVSSFNVFLQYEFDNPIIQKALDNINVLKVAQEKLLEKSPPAVNGQRTFEALPGLVVFPEGNKITGNMIITDQNFLKNCEFPFLTIKFQLSPKLPRETKTRNADGTNNIHYDFPVSFELEANETDWFHLHQIIVDYKEKKLVVTIQPLQWHHNVDNGEIVSFQDLFGKYLKLSTYYWGWANNQKKIKILSMILMNDTKRMQFEFKPEEKSNSTIDPNSAFIHQINDIDFVK
jgi:hypothetical protein